LHKFEQEEYEVEYEGREGDENELEAEPRREGDENEEEAEPRREGEAVGRKEQLRQMFELDSSV
jgi:hypothetical protein